MKNYKYILIAILGFTVFNCGLEEEPPYLANENVYSSASNAKAATLGMYSAFSDYFYYGNQFVFLVNLNSGFGVTRRGGNRNSSIDNTTLASLNPTSNSLQSDNAWGAIYKAIARNNDAIVSGVPFDDAATAEELGINDAIGQAYFLRAFNYFNLVRLWGEVPLRLEPTTLETVHVAKSPIVDIYTQIISDAKNAQKYMNGTIGAGTAKPFAADMLLAKVYMTLATAPSSHQPESGNYWQLAYNEAKKVYGQYSLYPSYDGLFDIDTGNNTEESIFEIQSSEGASLDHTRAFTPSNFTQANTFGWLKINAEVYDRHVSTYPNDPRLNTNYLLEYTHTGNGNNITVYPLRARNNFNNGFPWSFKLGSQDPNNTSRETAKNFKIYRYADVLLMLAEISNELQNGEQLGYVQEVLDRVGLTPHSGYSGGQESFRDAIMREYEFELVTECHDWFNNRRRGYNYFLNNVIIPHNTAPTFDANVDVTFETDENKVMYLPIPASEINNNNEISG